MILRKLLLGLLIAGASGCAAPLAAQADANAAAPAMAEDPIPAAKAASERGALLHSYDRAAWLGSDAFQADALRLGDIQPLGYLVLPGKEGALDFVVFGLVGGRGATPMQIGRYPVSGDKVVGGDLAIQPLGERELRMIAARGAAGSALVARGLSICGGAALNTVVLPPESDGAVTVYLLTPMTTPNRYPLGRHYRFDIAADGTVADWHELGAGCETVEWNPADEELAMRVHYIVAPAETAHPNEIHSFIAYQVPFPLAVITGAMVWPVLGGAIADPVEADPEIRTVPEL